MDGGFTRIDGSAFPWPHGWYYLKVRGDRIVWVWDGESGHFIDDDARLHAQERRMVWYP